MFNMPPYSKLFMLWSSNVGKIQKMLILFVFWLDVIIILKFCLIWKWVRPSSKPWNLFWLPRRIIFSPFSLVVAKHSKRENYPKNAKFKIGGTIDIIFIIIPFLMFDPTNEKWNPLVDIFSTTLSKNYVFFQFFLVLQKAPLFWYFFGWMTDELGP